MSGRVFSRASSPNPAVAVEAHGSTIVDSQGREYLDAAGGAIVVNVGHGRREIADAIAAQSARLSYAHGSAFTTEPLERYAAAVGAHLPMDDPAIYPVSGGSEATSAQVDLVRELFARVGRAIVIAERYQNAATAISGPACRNMTASASRVIAEPTVLVTATMGLPSSRARRVGAIVSAVSPDCVTAITSVFASRGGGAYRNSEPTVTRAGRPVHSWTAAAPTRAA